MNFLQHIGLRMLRDNGNGEAIAEVDIRPDLVNNAGMLQGGIVATLIDCAGGMAASRTTGSMKTFTADMNVHFLAAGRIGPVRAVGTVLRQGNAFWFGIAGQVTLYFRDQRLEQAEFKIEGAAPYQVDYARDQLRLAGYRSRCEQDEPTVQHCDWYGATNVRLDLKEHHLLAKIAPAEPPAEQSASVWPSSVPFSTRSSSWSSRCTSWRPSPR